MKLPPIQEKCVWRRRCLKSISNPRPSETNMRCSHTPEVRPKTRETEEGGEIVEITHFLYLGDTAAADNRQLLMKYGITLVINATLEVETRKHGGIRYLRISIKNERNQDIGRYFVPVAEEIKREEQNGGATLLHCSKGCGRSGALCVAYLLLYSPCNNIPEAYQVLKAKNWDIDINSGFLKQLIRLSSQISLKRLKERLQELLAKVPQARNLYLPQLPPL